MTKSSLSPGRRLALAALAGAGLLMSAPSQAAPAAPSAVSRSVSAVETVQWGPPYGHAYGYRRHHAYRPYGYYRPAWRHCRTVYERRWNAWRGGWVVQPVRRCW